MSCSASCQPPEGLAAAQSISVVVPCYRCEPYLVELCDRLASALSTVSSSFEVILVDDGSPLEDWRVIEELTKTHSFVTGIELSRNFGQHYAIAAGLRASKGEWIVVMDGDLQDRPEDIPLLYWKALEGYDSVFAERSSRADSFYRQWVSRSFYALLSYLTDTAQDPGVGNFGIYHRRVIDAICSLPEQLRYFPVMVRWVGFKSSTCKLSRDPRLGSPSSYSFVKLVRLAVDIMVAFSDKPLVLVTKLGFALSFFAGLGILNVVYRSFVGKVAVQGWASLMVTVSFLGGLTIFVLGMIGIYVGKVFDETKRRPIFIVRQTVGSELR